MRASIFLLLALLPLWPDLPAHAADAYTFTTLAGKANQGSVDGVGDGAQFNGPIFIDVDSSGDLYVVDAFNSTIRKVTPAGLVRTLAGFAGSRGINDGTGSNARFLSPRGIAVDTSGNLYVTDNTVIRKMISIGTNWSVSTIAGSPYGYGSNDGTGNNARFDGVQGIAVDSAGNLYVADRSNHTIRKITPLGTNWMVSTLAGSAGQPGTNNGLGAVARFNFPTGVALASSGDIYVADGDNHTIRKITPAGMVSTFAGLGGIPGSTDGTGTNARFDHPFDIAVDTTGNVYASDAYNHTVRKITSLGVVSTLAGLAGSFGNTDGTGSNAWFSVPHGITVDSTGNLYVADLRNNTIRKVTSAGVVSTVAGFAESRGANDGTGSTARFDDPSGVAVDSAGNLYAADSNNRTVRKITSAGVVSTLAGSVGNFGTNDGIGGNARFTSPRGIAIDSAGNLFLADSSHAIRKITPAGVVSTFAGVANSPGTNDGTGSNARFDAPYAIAVDSADNLYVADLHNHTIRKITPTRVVSTIAGSATIPGSNDGNGSNARFNFPQGIAVDNTGTIYVADTYNHTIRKITPAGMVSTLAGLATISGNADGVGAIARFYWPHHVAVDVALNLYVADSANFTIRKITPAGVVSTVGGLAGTGGSADGTGINALFLGPSGIAIDSNGTIFVADSGNNTIRKGVFTQFGAERRAFYVAPPMNGQLTVRLLPPEANGQWRFPWEFGWRNSGVTANNLVAGNYPIEFRNIPGYLALPIQPVQVSAGAVVSITNEYLPTLGAADTNSTPGSLIVFLGPTPPPGAGWRFIGENTPFLPNAFTTNLLPGTYLIEFALVNGRIKPASQTVQIHPGQSSVLAVNYLLAAPPPPNVFLPFPVPSFLVGDQTDYPFGFNGQLQSDKGYGSGVAVEDKVVLTAAHLVFNDQTLGYVSRVHWFFRRNASISEPLPQAARGYYVLSGYAAQRTNDLASGYSPDQSTPPSRNVDVAALYFLEPVAGGGHGGHLPSDAVPNTWLTSTALKMLTGYPVDGSQFGDASVIPGNMYQTDPQPYPLSLAPDPVPGQQQVYVAPWFLSYPGNSGGPLYVQLNDYYYPAAVYLGTLFSGSQPYASVVRAIDSTVVNLITLAASQGDSGTNHTGGGVVTIIPSQHISAANPGYVQFRLTPPAAVRAGAAWRLRGDTAYSNATNYTRAVTSTNSFAIEFRPVAGWNLPTNQNVTVGPGQLIPYTAAYTVTNPVLVAHLAVGIGMTGTTGTVYRLESKSVLTDADWLPVITNTITSTGFNLVLPKPPTNSPTRFYRLRWLQ